MSPHKWGIVTREVVRKGFQYVPVEKVVFRHKSQQAAKQRLVGMGCSYWVRRLTDAERA